MSSGIHVTKTKLGYEVRVGASNVGTYKTKKEADEVVKRSKIADRKYRTQYTKRKAM